MGAHVPIGPPARSARIMRGPPTAADLAAIRAPGSAAAARPTIPLPPIRPDRGRVATLRSLQLVRSAYFLSRVSRTTWVSEVAVVSEDARQALEGLSSAAAARSRSCMQPAFPRRRRGKTWGDGSSSPSRAGGEGEEEGLAARE
ncbi:hypothetical protein MRX96_054320 [Rhipicephalus microplus]